MSELNLPNLRKIAKTKTLEGLTRTALSMFVRELLAHIDGLQYQLEQTQQKCDPAGDIVTIIDLKEQRNALTCRIMELEARS